MSLKYGEIIAKMTLEEKASMMSGKNTWQTMDYEKYGFLSGKRVKGLHKSILKSRRRKGSRRNCFDRWI